MKICRRTFQVLILFSFFGLVDVGKVHGQTYLETDKNYYKSESVNKGFLDNEISESILGSKAWDMFQIAIQKKLIKYEPGMTFNQYSLANDISPEDNFTVYPTLPNQLIKLPSGAYLNANTNPKGAKDSDGNVVDYLTYVGPSMDRGAYWEDKELEDPILFSRLTVGPLPKEDNSRLKLFPDTTYEFPTQIGYGESGTANDYMLTKENKITIPTRFNTIRDDIYLTMRSRSYFGAGLKGAQAHLSAISNNQEVKGSDEDSKFFIDTNSSVFITPQGYDQLGSYSKILAQTVYTNASKSLKKVGINNFSEKMNAGLKNIQKNSGVKDIVSGNGGQIQLSGFDRKSSIDNGFQSNEDSRQNDSMNVTDITYYMYTDGNDTTTLTTPIAPNGFHLYSPNVSNFQLETTRPYFKVSDYENKTYEMQDILNNFSKTLGLDSFSLLDNGVQPNGDKITVDTSRVKVRVSKDGGKSFEKTSYELEQLKEAFSKNEFNNQKVTLAYTYAASDSSDDNLGKLPDEIKDNSGAYAVPIIRTVLPKPIIEGSVVTKYVDDAGKEISSQNTTTGEVGTDYATIKKEITGYTLTKEPTNKEGKYTDGVTTVVYTYKKDSVHPPLVEGSVVTKYVDEAGKEISSQNTTTGEVGTDYATIKKEIPGYTLTQEPTNKEGKYTDGVTTVVYTYKKDSVQPPLVEGSVVTKYVDDAGKELSSQNTTTGEVGTDYATIKKEIPGYTLTQEPTNKEGKYIDGVTTVVYTYKRESSTPSTPAVSTISGKRALPKTGQKTNWILSVIGAVLLILTVPFFCKK